jgi:LmbE family N-acetylglucosaminyl deacetylase
MTDVTDLGAVLAVWAHPDDETYLTGGLFGALTDIGHRVACITATRGEAGGATGSAGRLARLRTEELDAALKVLGVEEHHWLDYPDGGCADVDADAAANRVAAVMDDVRPDTVVTFGPDGYTGHPDHCAVSAWTGRAVAQCRNPPRLLHAVSREAVVDPALDEDFGVFELGRPRVCADEDMAVLLHLDGAALDRKVEALQRQISQTGVLIDAVGLERYRAWVATEAFAEPE